MADYDYVAERNALLGRSPLSALDSVTAPANAAPAEGAPAEGGLASVRAAIARRQKLQSDQQALFDSMARQLEERRTGPSTSEQLFELSAALARPTTVRGFSGVLNNVMPVLQQQARATREGTEGRMEAANALRLAQMKGALGLADTELETEVQLADLMAKRDKAPQSTWDTASQRFVSREVPMPTDRSARTKEGLRLTQYTDGSLRTRNADGSMDVYDAAGNKMQTIPAGGR